MRLHSLQVTAFGPFADTVQVDFDDLTAAGLFLIPVPTGAGQATLRAPTVFARYPLAPGPPPGARAPPSARQTRTP